MTVTRWASSEAAAQHISAHRRRAASRIPTKRLPEQAAISVASPPSLTHARCILADSDPFGPAVTDVC